MGCEIYFEVGPHSRGNGLAAAMPLRSIFPFEMMRCTAAWRHERLLAPCCCAANLCDERARCRSLLIAAAMARWRRISRGQIFIFPNFFVSIQRRRCPTAGQKRMLKLTHVDKDHAGALTVKL